MRITFIVGRYWPAAGGVETLAHHIARQLALRHDVTVIAHRIDDGAETRLTNSIRHPRPFQAFHDGAAHVIPVVLPLSRRIRLLPLTTQVLPGLRRYAYGRIRKPLSALYARVVSGVYSDQIRNSDVVHAWTVGMEGAAAMHAARASGRPFVLSPFVHPGQWGEDKLARDLLQGADGVVGLLDADASALMQLGVSPDRIATCGVCAEPVRAGGGRLIRSQFNVRGPLVLFLGVRRAYKGIDVLLAAAEQVAGMIPEVTFAFVGPGDSLPPHPRLARVLDIGPVGEEQRAAWLEAADLLCLPSAHEIFPVSVLEAWSVRTPVLVSDLPPLVELMSKSGGGLAIERNADSFADSICTLLREPTRLQTFGAAGHSYWSQAHTPIAVASHHEHLYERVINDHAA